MQVTVSTAQDIDIKSLAKAMANATPEEFAQFWFEFNEQIERQEGGGLSTLKKFAEKMADPLGANRTKPLEKLHSLMSYYKIAGREEK